MFFLRIRHWMNAFSITLLLLLSRLFRAYISSVFQLRTVHPRSAHLSVCQSDLNFIESILICYDRQNRFHIVFASYFLHLFLSMGEALVCRIRFGNVSCKVHLQNEQSGAKANKKHAIKNHRIVWYANW